MQHHCSIFFFSSMMTTTSKTTMSSSCTFLMVLLLGAMSSPPPFQPSSPSFTAALAFQPVTFPHTSSHAFLRYESLPRRRRGRRHRRRHPHHASSKSFLWSKLQQESTSSDEQEAGEQEGAGKKIRPKSNARGTKQPADEAQEDKEEDEPPMFFAQLQQQQPKQPQVNNNKLLNGEQQEDSSSSPLDSKNLIQAAELLMAATASSSSSSSSSDPSSLQEQKQQQQQQQPSSRRLLFASALIATGTAVAGVGVLQKHGGLLVSPSQQQEDDDDPISPPPPSPPSVTEAASTKSSASSLSYSSYSTDKLQWQVTPVNKRTGVTVFDAEASGYNVQFVTYLSRFLLCFDDDCQRWWYSRAGDLPRLANAEQVNEKRLEQFGAFSASVEVGLQGYRAGPNNNGPAELLQSLLRRYGPPPSTSTSTPALDDDSIIDPKALAEAREARRQIAILFGLMETNQPVEEITKLLAAIDNGSIAKVVVSNPGSGYAPGYGAPQVIFPSPNAENGQRATGRALLVPNGKILRIDVVNRGSGYKSSPPTVTIAPPAAIRFADANDDKIIEASTAKAKAFLFRNGPNKGRVERIQLLDPGSGYTKNEIIKVRLSEPVVEQVVGSSSGSSSSAGSGTSSATAGVTATATAVLEYKVDSIEILNNGTGYAVEKPFAVYVEPPPLTARVNMNDPLMARIVDPSQPLPSTSIPTKEMLKKMPDINDPTSGIFGQLSSQANRAGGPGGAGCIGRGCYDTPVVATAYPVAEKDSYTAVTIIRSANPTQLESQQQSQQQDDQQQQQQRVVSGSTSGKDIPELPNFVLGTSSSSQLLSLLPSGIGLVFNDEKGRYELAVDPNFQDATTGLRTLRQLTPYRNFDPDFGPRGRTPIERDMVLGVSSYARFVAAGAICCSGVHLALTPIDVVKTRIQSDPENYPGIVAGFKRVLAETGMSGFFVGWQPTFAGYFFWGGIAYTLTELFRRVFADFAGVSAGDVEVPIIICASGLAAVFGSFVICPFEAVRIRSVAQPDYAPSILGVLDRLVDDEGVGTLFAAVPVFLAKEIPFAIAKFTTFDLATAWMYNQFPAAQEDIQLSLLVSLLGGVCGGVTAAIVSNPADATISEMKRAKSNMGPVEAAQLVVSKGGYAGLFRGLPLRFVFYSLMVSFQFLIYDAVRFALGIGSDDLKLYLDVLGGVLRE